MHTEERLRLSGAENTGRNTLRRKHLEEMMDRSEKEHTPGPGADKKFRHVPV